MVIKKLKVLLFLFIMNILAIIFAFMSGIKESFLPLLTFLFGEIFMLISLRNLGDDS